MEVRFGGSSNPYEGYVELNINGRGWKGVCDDKFDLNDAHVVCRMAGYSQGAKKAHVKSQPFGYGASGANFAVDDLKCTGNEVSIADCPRYSWYFDNCSKKEWAGVTCKGTVVRLKCLHLFCQLNN